MVTLPSQNLAEFNTETAYTHDIQVIRSETFNNDPSCNASPYSCFTAAMDVKEISDLAADLTDHSTITFTVKAGITDNSYLA